MKIISAALKIGEAIISMPRPNRHHNLLREIFLQTDGSNLGKRAIQGFLTDEGTFLTREEAFVVALRFGLFKWGSKPHSSHILFSEDLW
jgi:hypothetical protein